MSHTKIKPGIQPGGRLPERLRESWRDWETEREPSGQEFTPVGMFKTWFKSSVIWMLGRQKSVQILDSFIWTCVKILTYLGNFKAEQLGKRNWT